MQTLTDYCLYEQDVSTHWPLKPLVISSGEPAGVGPDLCVMLAKHRLPIVVLGDLNVLKERAYRLGHTVHFHLYQENKPIILESGHLTVWPINCPHEVEPGVLNSLNAPYVVDMLDAAARFCSENKFSALVTAPVHKANINAAGIAFTGHTEFLAQWFDVETVMMLACGSFRVALMTTHMPLRAVPEFITESLIMRVVTEVHQTLVHDFKIKDPVIKVAGLNPHAGESGYLGTEEIDTIIPALNKLRKLNMNIEGPFSADTMFTKTQDCDAFVAMYHDQGLPVLKFESFNQAVNITLGLPIIRTSVDHGTALELAGTHHIQTGSMLTAVHTAMNMVKNRTK